MVEAVTRMSDSRPHSVGSSSPDRGPQTTNCRYEPIDSDSAREVEARRRWCYTNGTCFNLVVGLVICANAVLLGIQADLGSLSDGSARWKGLDEDLNNMDFDNATKAFKAEVKKGIKADARLKGKLQDGISNAIHKKVPLQKELALQHGSYLGDSAYTSADYFFVLFFTVELLMRFRDQGCRSYCTDPWFGLDILCVIVGLVDVTMPFISPCCTDLQLEIMADLRVSRILRVLRILRVSSALRALAQPLISAFQVLLRVSVIIVILNFVVAVILTSLIGQRAHLWGADHELEVEQWFGSIGMSMQTLFTIMTFSGWDHIALVLVQVIPGFVLVPCVVLYIMVFTFAMVGLVTGVTSNNLTRDATIEEAKRHHEKERLRVAAASAITDELATLDQSRNASLNRERLASALDTKLGVFRKLEQHDINSDTIEILQIFDRLSQSTPSSAGGNVDVSHLANAITNLRGYATAFSIAELQHSIGSLRQESFERIEEVKLAVAERNQEITVLVTNIGREVGHVSKQVEHVQQEIAALATRFEKSEKREEASRRGHEDALTQLSKKNDMVAAQIASQATAQATVHGIVEGLSSQFALYQAAATTKADAIGGKVDAVVAQFAAQTRTHEETIDLISRVETKLEQALKTSNPASGNLLGNARSAGEDQEGDGKQRSLMESHGLEPLDKNVLAEGNASAPAAADASALVETGSAIVASSSFTANGAASELEASSADRIDTSRKEGFDGDIIQTSDEISERTAAPEHSDFADFSNAGPIPEGTAAAEPPDSADFSNDGPVPERTAGSEPSMDTLLASDLPAEDIFARLVNSQ